MQLSSVSKPSLAQQSTSKEHLCVSHCFPSVFFFSFLKQWNMLGLESEFLKVTGTSRISCLKHKKITLQNKELETDLLFGFI